LRFEVKSVVDGGALMIPSFDENKLEKTVDRSLFAKLHLLGFPSDLQDSAMDATSVCNK
jgi:hypothetical protein